MTRDGEKKKRPFLDWNDRDVIAAALGTVVTGILMATGVAVPAGSSGLGLVVIGALVWASALALSIAVVRFIHRCRGE